MRHAVKGYLRILANVDKYQFQQNDDIFIRFNRSLYNRGQRYRFGLVIYSQKNLLF